jgi:hypothetical protein
MVIYTQQNKMSFGLFEETTHIQFYFGPDVEPFDLQHSLERTEYILTVVMQSEAIIEPMAEKLKTEIHKNLADSDEISRLYSKILCNVNKGLKLSLKIGCPVSKTLDVELLRKLQTKVYLIKEKLDHVCAETLKFNMNYEEAVDRLLILNQTMVETLQYLIKVLNKNIVEYFDKK